MTHTAYSLILLAVVAGFTGCSATSLAPQGDFDLNRVPGLESLQPSSLAEYHSAIEVAFLDGQLTGEQARRAHDELEGL